MTQRIGSFFAGIGGFDYAFEREGFETVFQCEIDPFCTAVLKAHWPHVERIRDIRSIAAGDIPKAAIWCGGFPCQDVSVARAYRAREGLRGKNTGLFFSFLKLVQERLPSVLLLENVEGLLNSHNGQDFRVILEELTGLGYSVAWRIMNSRYFGAPQSRPRVYICAARSNHSLPLSTLFEHDRGTRGLSRREGFLTVDECGVSGALVPRVAYCLAATSGRHTGTDWSRTYISYPDGVRRLTPSECEGLQGFPANWTAHTEGIRLNTYDLDTPRYKALGNSVAVPVVRWIARRLLQSLALSSRSNPRSGIEEIVGPFADFSDKSARLMKFDELHYSTRPNGHHLRWQSGGFALGNFCIDIKAPSAPNKVVEHPLINVVEKMRPESHYFLSSNAAEGILRRVGSQNRTLFGPMHKALEFLARSA